jgi:hypothetical protein
MVPVEPLSFVLNSTNQTRGQRDQGYDQFQRSVYRDAGQAEWQQNQPHQRIQDQRHQGQGPAKEKEDTPQQKLDHRHLPQDYFEGRGFTAAENSSFKMYGPRVVRKCFSPKLGF